MCCNRIYSQCLLSFEQILYAVEPYRTKPDLNDCDIAHVCDEDPDSAKRLNRCSLSSSGSFVLVSTEMLELRYFMSQN